MKSVDDGGFTFDRARQILTVATALAQAALPTLLVPRFPPELQPPDVIEPAPYTFAVWLPMFGSSLAYAAAQARPRWAPSPVAAEPDGPSPPLSQVSERGRRSSHGHGSGRPKDRS